MISDDPPVAPITSNSEEPTPNIVATAKLNWFVRHWRGDESLGRAYWLNLVLICNLTFSTLFAIAYTQLAGLAGSLRLHALAALVLRVALYAFSFWAIVGVVRSANKHTSRGGTLFWANTARVVVCLSVLLVGYRVLNGEFAGLRELTLIGAGHDPMPKMWSQDTGKPSTIWLQGLIGEGSAKAVQIAFDAHPQATTVILSSRGGRTWEAERIARQVQARGLNTVIRGKCESACTYIFLAGNRRWIEDGGKIGFHQAYFPGSSVIAQQLLNRKMGNYYFAVGLPEWFVKRTLATTSATMWYPNQDELREAHVIKPLWSASQN
jgi:hypothetical protein